MAYTKIFTDKISPVRWNQLPSRLRVDTCNLYGDVWRRFRLSNLYPVHVWVTTFTITAHADVFAPNTLTVLDDRQAKWGLQCQVRLSETFFQYNDSQNIFANQKPFSEINEEISLTQILITAITPSKVLPFNYSIYIVLISQPL